MALRSAEAYWDPAKPEVQEALRKDIKDLSKDDLVMLVKELDRRFIQLWDKVTYEQKNGFVDYSK